MEEIRINGPANPHLPQKRFLSIRILNIGISLQALLIEVSAILDARIDDWNPPVVLQQIGHLLKREPALIDGEDLTIDHIIKITPNGIKWDLVFFEVIDYLLKVYEGFVAPSALLVAKRPERRQVCPTAVDVELVDGGFWVGVAEEEAEVYNAADGLEDEVVEMLWCVACGLDRIHCVGGAVVAHMEKAQIALSANRTDSIHTSAILPQYRSSLLDLC